MNIAAEVVDTRGVDDVHLVAVHIDPGHAGGDGLLLLDFLFEVVKDGAAVVDVAAATHFSCDVQHCIGQRGLAHSVRSDQGHIADLLHGVRLQRSSSQVVHGFGRFPEPGSTEPVSWVQIRFPGRRDTSEKPEKWTAPSPWETVRRAPEPIFATKGNGNSTTRACQQNRNRASRAKVLDTNKPVHYRYLPGLVAIDPAEVTTRNVPSER